MDPRRFLCDSASDVAEALFSMLVGYWGGGGLYSQHDS